MVETSVVSPRRAVRDAAEGGKGLLVLGLWLPWGSPGAAELNRPQLPCGLWLEPQECLALSKQVDRAVNTGQKPRGIFNLTGRLTVNKTSE